jgi:predicted nucleic acid-binding protein
VSTSVIDASALVELLLGTPRGRNVDQVVAGTALIAPAHIDAEVFSALGRMHRAGLMSARLVSSRLGWLENAQIERAPLSPLLSGAWKRRQNLSLVDALYVELAATTTGAALVTCDRGMAANCLDAVLVTGAVTST